MRKQRLSLENVKPLLFKYVHSTPGLNGKTVTNIQDLPDSELLQTSFGLDLGIDSLDFVLFCLDLERELDINIDLDILEIDLGSKLTLFDFIERVNNTLS